MRLALLLLLVLALSAPGTAAAHGSAEQPDGVDPDSIDTFVTGYLDRHGLPGAAVAVVEDGARVHEAGYGHDSTGARLTARSRLRIGSVSKSFTAFAVLQLVQQGRVELDAPVTRYLPDFAPGEATTVRHLLSHTSGLPNPTIVGPATSLAAGAARTRTWELASQPGTSYAYSNANYWVAARVVEEASGQPFDDYLAEHVFAPLGMDDTFNTTTTRDPAEGLAAGHVTAYGAAMPSPEPAEMSSGAGGVVSTAHDMAAWLAMQQRGGTGPGGRRLLTQTLIEQSHTPQPNAGRYGLGWQRSSPGITPERISHSGLIAGFNAQQDLVPSSGYGVAVMLNSFTPTREHAYEISTGIIALTEGRRPQPGPPVATLVDLGLGAATATVLALGALGLRRARTWSARRRTRPRWRFVLRLLPQQIAPALAVFLFLIAPALQDNSFTPIDVFRLFPALAVLILALAATGAGLTAARAAAFVRSSSPPDRAARS